DAEDFEQDPSHEQEHYHDAQREEHVAKDDGSVSGGIGTPECAQEEGDIPQRAHHEEEQGGGGHQAHVVSSVCVVAVKDRAWRVADRDVADEVPGEIVRARSLRDEGTRRTPAAYRWLRVSW